MVSAPEVEAGAVEEEEEVEEGEEIKTLMEEAKKRHFAVGEKRLPH